MASELKVLKLPFHRDGATLSLFYKKVSELELEAYNLPMAPSQEELKSYVEEIFGLFGHVEEVELEGDVKATIKYFKATSIERALEGKFKHQRDVPTAYTGEYGTEYFEEQHAKKHPSIESLEAVSSKHIAEFEAAEARARATTGSRHIARTTEAQTQEIIRKYQEKVKAMQSNDFYSFQQKDRPNLLTGLLAPVQEKEPRHLKKKPKAKKLRQMQANQAAQAAKQ